MKESVRSIFLAYVLLTVVSGCAVPKPTAVPATVTLTSTAPTGTPVPTATSTKPPTSVPTLTIEPPTVTTKFLTDIKILSHDPFDNDNHLNNWGIGWNWSDHKIGNIANGIFEIKGISSFWGTVLSTKRQFIYGDGVILKFKLQNANGKSAFAFFSGLWQTEEYGGFVVTNDRRPRADLNAGTEGNVGGDYLRGNLRLKSDAWYNVLMAMDKNGEFLVVMWDPTNEAHQTMYHATIGEKLSGKSWFFSIRESEGETLYIDDFYTISFKEIK